MTKNWNEINWKQCFETLEKLQYKILMAFREKNMTLVQNHQEQLIRSFAARALAVRKVVSNKSKNTRGINKVIWDRNELRFQTIGKLKNLLQYKALDVRKIYIPKSEKESCSLGIPSMFDRAVQTLFLFTIDPIAEETSCKYSYGYRLHRSAKDCAAYLWLISANPTTKRRFVLKAGIKGFFSAVFHKWLSENVPVKNKFFHEFLKAGFTENSLFHGSFKGFFQSSPILLTLINLTLNGLEKILKGHGFLITRYCDVFVVLGESKEKLNNIAKVLITNFLVERGLKLNKITPEIYDIEKGYSFLGYKFKEYCDNGRIKGNKKGIFLVTPSPEKIKTFCKELRLLIKNYNQKLLYELIRKLNKKLRVWAEYYRTVSSQKAFNIINHRIWNALWRKIVKRHRRRSKSWLFKKYFTRKKGSKWIFIANKETKNALALFQIPYVPIKRHTLTSDANAYDLKINDYFKKTNNTRSKTSLLQSTQADYLLKVQKGVCFECSQSLLNNEDIIIISKISQNFRGKPKRYNKSLLHQVCASKLKSSLSKDH